MRQMLLIVTLGMAACTKPAQAPSQSEAEKIVADAEASFTSGDAQKIMGHYADGAVVFDPSLLEPSADRTMQTKWAAAFTTMQPADMTIASRQLQVLDADTMVASGVMSFTAQVGPNRQLLRTRFSDVYQKQADGSWKIVHEHMSGPPPETPLP